MRLGWLGLLLLLIPSNARAELAGCLLTGANSDGGASIACEGLELCASGAVCRDGLACNVTSGLCLPECSTIVGCDADEECDALRVGGSCQRFASGMDLWTGGVCTAPELPIQYCNGTGNVSVDRFLACHTLPFSDTLAPSWFDGDCDGDGCSNGGDLLPCISGGACGRPDPLALLCPHRLVGVGPERCVFLPSGAPSCATAHPCSAASECPEGFACSDETCEPVACTAVYSCRNVADCPRGTELGEPVVCLPTARLDPGRGHGDGFCLFDSFAVTSACFGLLEAQSCFFRDGAFSNDFFQGDCDLDGCPNGLDPSPCSVDGAALCRPDGTSPACDTPIPPARLDAGVPFEDAALPDGGGTFDAAVFDGGTNERVTFGGGGGCVCRAGRSAHHGALMSLVSFLVLSLLLLRRRA